MVISFACIKLEKAGVIPYKKIVPREKCYSLKLGSGIFCWSHLDLDARGCLPPCLARLTSSDWAHLPDTWDLGNGES